VSVERIYWDSDPFLAWLQNEAGKVDLCNGTIKRAAAGEILIVTSALTLAEVLWRRGGPKLPADKLALLRKFFRRSYIRVVNVSRVISEEAQDVVMNFNIKPKDAIHVATAIHHGIDILETFDEGLLAQSGKVGTLIIRKPILPPQGELSL
jgi:predicted nucleic acid-binding protein